MGLGVESAALESFVLRVVEGCITRQKQPSLIRRRMNGYWARKRNNRELCTFYGYTSILPHHWQIVGNICISVLPSFTQSQQWRLVIALLSNELSIYQYFRILLNTVFLESDIN